MTTTFLPATVLPYIVHVYDRNSVFKKTVQILNHPALSMVVNSTGQAITLDMPAANTVAPLVSQGDLIKITEQNGDGSVLYTGIVEDLPDTIDQTTEHQITLAPLGVELAETDFTNNYTTATDIGQMIRDAVARTAHCTATVSTVPNTGLTRIFNFNTTNALQVLQTAAKMAGSNYVWFVDELGQVWFGPTSSGFTYSVKTRVDAPVRKYTAPITTLKNFIQGFGAVIPNTQGTRVTATFDQTSGSPYGRRALIPPLFFPNLTDQPTLQSIVNTVGTALNQIQVSVTFELPNFGQRINLAKVGGALVRYFEPSVDIYPETDPGSGAYSVAYGIVQVDVDGPVQRITARSIALNVDDFVNEINDTMNRVAGDTVPALYPITPGQVAGGTGGGATTPAVPAFDVPRWSTGVDNIAQVNNAYIIVKWTPNIASDNVSHFEIRYSKNNDGNYTSVITPAPPALDVNGDGFVKIAGLIQATSYTFQIRAINNLGIASAFSAGQAQVSAAQTLAPAVPTGLAAYKTPRGALVSWNGNTEADLQGYEIQVSVGGGAFSLVTPGWQLGTSLVYIAATGTALGTSLAFQVRAANWTGNISAWSASSTAVNTDGIAFDELLVGNLKVFGTITTGGLQTASSGARVIIDATSIRISDGTTNNYGAPSGAGVTAELKNDGTAFFKGTITASAISASNITGGTIAIGSGNAIFKADSAGIYLGNASFASAPFSVDMNGNLIANSATVKGNLKTGAGGLPLLFGDSLEVAAYNPTTGTLWHSLGNEPGTDNSIAYWTVTAGAFTFASNLASVSTATGTMVGGHADWDNYTFWVRFKMDTGGFVQGFVRYVDANNYIFVNMQAGVLSINKRIAGTNTGLANTSFSPVNGNFYWFKIAVSGPTVTASIYNDSGGAVGAIGAGPVVDTVTDSAVVRGKVGVSGQTTSVQFGGAFANVCYVTGPVPQFQTKNWTPGVQAGEPAFAWSVQQDFTGTRSLSIYSPIAAGQGFWALTPDIVPGACTLSAQLRGTGTITGQFVASYGRVGISPDSVQETATLTNGFLFGAITLATFKAATTIARVGVLGAVAVGTATQVSPAFGQSTTSGNLLVGWVTQQQSSGAINFTVTGPTGWVRAGGFWDSSTNFDIEIWYKPNCGAAETPPTFNGASGSVGRLMHAQLAEFSGAATVSPVDQTASSPSTLYGGPSPQAELVTANAVDAAGGDLIVTCSRWGGNQTPLNPGFSDIINNTSTVVAQTTSGTGLDSTPAASNFVYGIAPSSSVITTTQPVADSAWHLVSASGTPTAGAIQLIAQGAGTWYFDNPTINPTGNNWGTARLWMDTTQASPTAGLNPILVADDGLFRRFEYGNLAAYTGPDGAISPAQFGVRIVGVDGDVIADSYGLYGVATPIGSAAGAPGTTFATASASTFQDIAGSYFTITVARAARIEYRVVVSGRVSTGSGSGFIRGNIVGFNTTANIIQGGPTSTGYIWYFTGPGSNALFLPAGTYQVKLEAATDNGTAWVCAQYFHQVLVLGVGVR